MDELKKEFTLVSFYHSLCNNYYLAAFYVERTNADHRIWELILMACYKNSYITVVGRGINADSICGNLCFKN